MNNKSRLGLAASALLLVYLLLALRLFAVQIVGHKKYSKIARNSYSVKVRE